MRISDWSSDVCSSDLTEPFPLTAPPMGGDAAKRLKPFGLQQQPFFADKNRAFWTLQSAGWAGYFILRSLSGIANAFGFTFIVPPTLLTATCYSTPLLLPAPFRRPLQMPPLHTWDNSN